MGFLSDKLRHNFFGSTNDSVTNLLMIDKYLTSFEFGISVLIIIKC